jgi:hypothetical protein
MYNNNNKIAYNVWRGIAGLLIEQWQVGGGVLNARCQVMWQKGGQWQTRGILDTRHQVSWQSGG